jgi:hypothetical protein
MLVCCRRCRLVQEQTAVCGACAGEALERADEVQRLASSQLAIRPRERRMGRSGESLALLLLGSMLYGLGEIGSFVGTFCAVLFFGYVVSDRRVVREDVLRPVRLLPPESYPRRTGTVRPKDTLLPQVSAVLRGVTIGPQIHMPMFRRVFAVDFWLIPASGERILVTGPIALANEGEDLGPTLPDHLALVGLPLDLDLPRGMRTRETVVPAGVQVQVSGEPRRELIAGLSYRDQEALVLRGLPGAPIRVQLVQTA